MQTCINQIGDPTHHASGINDSSIYFHPFGVKQKTNKKQTNKQSNKQKNIVILDKEHIWFERGIKKAIYKN